MENVKQEEEKVKNTGSDSYSDNNDNNSGSDSEENNKDSGDFPEDSKTCLLKKSVSWLCHSPTAMYKR